MKNSKGIGTAFVVNTQQNIAASQGQSLLEALQSAKVEMDSSCGGHGTCGTCRVFINHESSQVPPMNEVEAEFWSERGRKTHERLSCQVEAPFDLEIELIKN